MLNHQYLGFLQLDEKVTWLPWKYLALGHRQLFRFDDHVGQQIQAAAELLGSFRLGFGLLQGGLRFVF